MGPAVELRDVVSLLGRFPALAGVSLRMEPGEIVLLQGPNGAGKSTLLRLCAGLLRVESGTGRVLDHDLQTGRREIRRRVGLLSHSTGLYDDLTVAENVEFWARASHAEAEAVPGALDRIGLAARLREVPVRRLSAGQRRRTALATVMVRRPELWLLDEPHAALDQQGRDSVDQLIVDASAAGATVMVASHELDRVAGLSRRIVTIAGGIIVADTGRDSVSQHKEAAKAGQGE